MLKNLAEENSIQWKNLSKTSFTHVLHVPKCPQLDIFHPKSSHGNMIKGLTQAITRARKGKGPKCTTHFRYPMENCFPYWSRIMGFLLFLQGQEDLHIRKDTILMPNVSTTEELEGTPRKIAWPLRTRSNPWSTQIRSNSENLSVVIKSIKIKDQLGAVFVCLLIMNVFIYECTFEKCKLYFDISICMKWIDLSYTPFVIMNFIDASKKRINPSAKENGKYGWKCFQILERQGS